MGEEPALAHLGGLGEVADGEALEPYLRCDPQRLVEDRGPRCPGPCSCAQISAIVRWWEMGFSACSFGARVLGWGACGSPSSVMPRPARARGPQPRPRSGDVHRSRGRGRRWRGLITRAPGPLRPRPAAPDGRAGVHDRGGGEADPRGVTRRGRPGHCGRAGGVVLPGHPGARRRRVHAVFHRRCRGSSTRATSSPATSPSTTPATRSPRPTRTSTCCCPSSAPWLKASEAVDFARLVRAPRNRAIHDRIYTEAAHGILEGHMNAFPPDAGQSYVRPVDGADL